MAFRFRLLSHALCPYVQRAAIVLTEKGVAFDRVDIDLAHKPDWFLQLSPLGKTPVLMVDGEALFESSVICEYLDEIVPPTLHPVDPLARARHRAWMAFGSAVLDGIAAFYSAPDADTLAARANVLRTRFEAVEAVLTQGPYFDGERFSMVDAVFGPVFRYFDVFDPYDDGAIFERTPKVRAWRLALAQRPSVQGAVPAGYAAALRDFLRRRGSALSALISAESPSWR